MVICRIILCFCLYSYTCQKYFKILRVHIKSQWNLLAVGEGNDTDENNYKTFTYILGVIWSSKLLHPLHNYEHHLHNYGLLSGNSPTGGVVVQNRLKYHFQADGDMLTNSYKYIHLCICTHFINLLLLLFGMQGLTLQFIVSVHLKLAYLSRSKANVP